MTDGQFFGEVFKENGRTYTPDAWHDSYKHHDDWFVLDQGDYSVTYHATSGNKEEVVDKTFKAEK